jgi:hypothetical protein
MNSRCSLVQVRKSGEGAPADSKDAMHTAMMECPSPLMKQWAEEGTPAPSLQPERLTVNGEARTKGKITTKSSTDIVNGDSRQKREGIRTRYLAWPCKTKTNPANAANEEGKEGSKRSPARLLGCPPFLSLACSLLRTLLCSDATQRTTHSPASLSILLTSLWPASIGQHICHASPSPTPPRGLIPLA